MDTSSEGGQSNNYEENAVRMNAKLLTTDTVNCAFSLSRFGADFAQTDLAH